MSDHTESRLSAADGNAMRKAAREWAGRFCPTWTPTTADVLAGVRVTLHAIGLSESDARGLECSGRAGDASLADNAIREQVTERTLTSD